jgi:hypothetical protein
MTTANTNPTSTYLVANRIDRAEADRLRAEQPGVVVSRNTDGTYRVTRGR